MSAEALKVSGLTKHFPFKRGYFGKQRFVRAVDGVDFDIATGDTFGLVGESGCGKTTLAMLISRLQAPTSGAILYEGDSVPAMKGEDLKAFRRSLQIVYQDPLGSLDPRQRVIDVLVEPMLALGVTSKRADAAARASSMLEQVGLGAELERRLPHELSGGQRQRVCIARALGVNPRFLILDEPLSALDVSVQAQVLNLLKSLKQSFSLTYLMISHNLVAARYMSDTIAVMYLGKIVELASASEIFEFPQHPYTYALLCAMPLPDPDSRNIFPVIEGEVPSAVDIPSGCRFHNRCPYAKEKCREVEPALSESRSNHPVACHYPGAWLS